MKETINVSTFNVRTLSSGIRQQQLAGDLERYKIDILCLQETKLSNGIDINFKEGRLICFPSSCKYYGCGFLINKNWVDRIHKTWNVSDRVCVIQLHTNATTQTNKTKSKPDLFTIINIYAPTTQRAQANPEELKQFYYDLNNTIDIVGNKTFLIIAGDFNAKVGKQEEGDLCLGKHSKGKRNESGEKLVDFCETRNLFITNSAFSHPSRHQTTWIGQRRDSVTGHYRNIFNQIDFIVCQQRYKHLITNSRSYSGTILTSDHKLVKTNFVLDWHKVWRKKESKKIITPKINVSDIANKQTHQIKYQQLLDTQLLKIEHKNNNRTPNEKWQAVQCAIKDAAEQSVGTVKHSKQNRTPDSVITHLSHRQKDLRVKINNEKNENERAKLKKERNAVLHSIHTRVIKLRNEELDRKAEYVDNAKTDCAMFRAIKIINVKPFENPKVADDSGKLTTNPNDILTIVANHFKNKFEDKNSQSIQPFYGKPRPLTNPITALEVRKSFNSLKNNKAPGEDNINPEFLKYGSNHLDEIVADIINESFANHEELKINTGVLIAIQKPGKSKGPPKNLRPITLLNTLRKALSIIILNRIRPNVEEYLSSSQSGFRPERSTADVIWAHKWLAAKVNAEELEIKITGIDMSAAFDTIDRGTLIEILAGIIDDDELRIIQFLLSNTEINTRINNATIQLPFTSNVGTPQGDSLSPVLFALYLENALRDVRKAINKPALQSEIPSEISYADDVDFIGTDFVDVNEIQHILEKHQLYVNVDKTELTTLKREEPAWRKTKKVGSLLGDAEDVERRKQLSTAALNKLTSIWIRDNKIKRNIRIKLYKSLIKSILTYNCGTWALTQSETDKLDAFHRKQLRKILNIRYPVIISNKQLYKVCNEKPLSSYITECRWRLFGHILRRQNDIPANKAMDLYFLKSARKFKGRPLTTLPVVLNKDLARSGIKLELKSNKDLDKLKAKAQNRKHWNKLTTKITRAAEAVRSVDPTAEGP